MLFEKANNQVAFAFRENRMHNIAQANFFFTCLGAENISMKTKNSLDM